MGYHRPSLTATTSLRDVTNVIFDTSIEAKRRFSDRIRRRTSKLSRSTPLPHFEEDQFSLNEENLTKISLLGTGSFGKVWLCRHRVTDEAFALKVQEKRLVLKKGQAEGAMRERKIMAKVDHPFIIKLDGAFQDDENLFMAMPYVQGGELTNRIRNGDVLGLPEHTARFYAACLADAFNHLHHQGILYRDLKPENVMIDSHGYPKLIDLGFAKIVKSKTYTMCGSLFHLAPEIVLQRGYDKGVDNWALAVLVYEMIYGSPPFFSKNTDQMTVFQRIVKVDYKFPTDVECSIEARDFIQRILVLNPTKRLGSETTSELCRHAWFSDISRAELLSKSIMAPWVPKANNPLDTSNFQTVVEPPPKKKLFGGRRLKRKEQDIFRDFSFTT